MSLVRSILLSLVLLSLGACGPGAIPSPSATPVPTVPFVAAILAAPTPGPITTTGLLWPTPPGTSLVTGLSLTPTGLEPLDGPGLWLEPAPVLPAKQSWEGSAEAPYLVVEARGQLEGPGQYGPAGQYAYQLSAAQVRSLPPRDLTMAQLFANRDLYEGQPVRLSGSLLAAADSTLLVERIGPGGVPTADTLLLKLTGPWRDQALLDQLQTTGGRVRFGPVTVLGLWHGGQLEPLHTILANP